MIEKKRKVGGHDMCDFFNSYNLKVFPKIRLYMKCYYFIFCEIHLIGIYSLRKSFVFSILHTKFGVIQFTFYRDRYFQIGKVFYFRFAELKNFIIQNMYLYFSIKIFALLSDMQSVIK